MDYCIYIHSNIQDKINHYVKNNYDISKNSYDRIGFVYEHAIKFPFFIDTDTSSNSNVYFHEQFLSFVDSLPKTLIVLDFISSSLDTNAILELNNLNKVSKYTHIQWRYSLEEHGYLNNASAFKMFNVNVNKIEYTDLTEYYFSKEIVKQNIFLINIFPFDTHIEMYSNTSYKKVLYCNPNVSNIHTLLPCIASDVKPYITSKLFASLSSEITHIGFLYHNSTIFPYLNESEDSDSYFSNDFFPFLDSIKHYVIIDFISCTLPENAQKEIKTLSLLDEYQHITFRYSLNDTGNFEFGGDWIMEVSTKGPENIDLQHIYFNETIFEWNTILFFVSLESHTYYNTQNFSYYYYVLPTQAIYSTFYNCSLYRADLTNANLMYSKFYSNTYYYMNLSGAYLWGTYWNTNLIGPLMGSSPILSGLININRIFFKKNNYGYIANLEYFNLFQTYNNFNFMDLIFDFADFFSSIFENCTFERLNLTNQIATNYTFLQCDFQNCDFTDASLNNVDFSGSTFEFCTFTNADVSGVNWYNVKTKFLIGDSPKEDTLGDYAFYKNADGSVAYIIGPYMNLSNEILSFVNFTGIDITNVYLSNANLSNTIWNDDDLI